jgi:SAM-dependent methyltransferase
METEVRSSLTVPVDEVIGWDVGNWCGCLDYWYPWLSSVDRNTGNILVLGERGGGISLWLALLGFRVLCTDRTAPSKEVYQLHGRWHVREKMTYSEVDIFQIPFPDNHFHVVVCKSVIGGLKLKFKDPATRSLENQKLAVEEVRRVLKPGGVFLGAENMVGTRFHEALRKTRHKGRAGWRYLQPPEIQWLFHDYARCEQKPWGFLGTHWPKFFGLNKITKAADAALSRILPPAWLYISFIRARK